MKQRLSFFIIFWFLLIGFSCEYENQEENDVRQDVIDLSLISAFRDIDGGELPEVTVTAHWPRVEEPVPDIDPDGNMPDASDSRPWWEPPTGGEPAGGGGGHSSSIGNVILSTNLLKRFPGGSNLSKADLTKLNEEYKRLLLECVYNSIDNYISSHWRKSGQIKMYGSQIGLASLDSRGNLNFYGSDQITATNLAHEWIHAYQMAFNPSSSNLSNEYVGMMEFELALFQDLICYAKSGYTSLSRGDGYFPGGSCWINSLKGSNRGRYYYEQGYMKWLESICVNNQLPVKIDQTMYLYWARVFGDHLGYSDKGYNFQNKEYGTKTLESLLDMAARNCFK